VSLAAIDVNKPDADGVTPLMAATNARHVRAMRVLLETEAVDPNLRDRRGMTAFHFAIRSLSDPVVAELFLCDRVHRDIRDNAQVSFALRRPRLTTPENMN
jgi:hypothetical protein